MDMDSEFVEIDRRGGDSVCVVMCNHKHVINRSPGERAVVVACEGAAMGWK